MQHCQWLTFIDDGHVFSLPLLASLPMPRASSETQGSDPVHEERIEERGEGRKERSLSSSGWILQFRLCLKKYASFPLLRACRRFATKETSARGKPELGALRLEMLRTGLRQLPENQMAPARRPFLAIGDTRMLYGEAFCA